MKFKGFEKEDFELFEIEGLQNRMDVLIEQLRPKFNVLGEELKTVLEKEHDEIVYSHVAKHARRKTNPPNDSWVAFALTEKAKRGYKMHPHFQITLWSNKVLIQWGLIYECEKKYKFAEELLKNKEEIIKKLPSNYTWFKDHMKPEGKKHSEIDSVIIEEFANELKNKKKAELMIGLEIEKEKALEMSPEDFYKLVEKVWTDLSYLHRMTI